MRLPRFLVIGKYEAKKYLSGQGDKTTFLLATVFVLLILTVPQSESTYMPSAKGIYKVGLRPDSPLKRLGSYKVRYFIYSSKADLIQENSLGEIDAFAVSEGNVINIYGSGDPKSDAALTRLHELVKKLNVQRGLKYVKRNESLKGVFFPIRTMVVQEEINYTGMLNVTMNQRRRFLDVEESTGKRETVSSPTPSGEGAGEEKEKKDDVEVVEFSGEEGEATYLEKGLPSNFDTGIPFSNLYKNMSYLSPLVMLSILFALSLARERVEDGIENLLTAPVDRVEILLGKASPYLTVGILYCLGLGFYLADGLDALKVSFIYMVLATVMLSFSVYTMITSRSYRELTFIGSFALFTFFFFIILPNVFSGVNVLAYISPLDLLTSIKYGAAIGFRDVFLSLLPYMALSLFFISFTAVCFHSEVLFGDYGIKKLFSEFYRGLAQVVKNPVVYTFTAISLLVPFIYVVESISAYLIMPLGFLAPLISVVFLAALEEAVKIIPYLYRKTNPLLYSVTAGVGFFVSEKLFNAYLISKVYEILGGPYTMYVMKGALTTSLVHVSTVLAFSLSIRHGKGKLHYLLGFLLAVTIHFIYNLQVMYGIL